MLVGFCEKAKILGLFRVIFSFVGQKSAGPSRGAREDGPAAFGGRDVSTRYEKEAVGDIAGTSCLGVCQFCWR